MKDKGERVIVWTAKEDVVMRAIEKDGVSFVKKEYLDKKYGATAWIFKTAYEFFVKEAVKRVSKPDEAESPVWVFKDERNVFKSSTFLSPSKDGLYYEREMVKQSNKEIILRLVLKTEGMVGIRHEEEKIIVKSYEESYSDLEGYNIFDIRYTKEELPIGLISNKRKEGMLGRLLNKNGEERVWDFKKIIPAGVILVAAIAGVAYYQLVGQYNIKADSAYVNAQQAEILPQINGTVRELVAGNSKEVNQGDLLIVLDDTSAKLDLQNAEAGVAQAVKSYYALVAQSNALDQEIETRQAAVNRLASVYENAKKSGDEDKISSAQDAYESAQSELKVSMANAITPKSQLTNSLEEYPAFQQAVSKFKIAYTNLARTRMYSPITGKTSYKNLSVGQKIQENQPALTVANLKNMWVDANVKESKLKNIKIGNEVTLVSSVNGKTYEGNIIDIAPVVVTKGNKKDNRSKTVSIKIAISKRSLARNGELPIGSSMAVNIKTKADKNSAKKEKATLKLENVTNTYEINDTIINQEIAKIVEKYQPKN